MTLQWIPLASIERHPENSNRMPPHLMEKLKTHIERTGLYEPLVVRLLPAQAERAAPNIAPSRDRKVAGGFPAAEPSCAPKAPPTSRRGGDLKSEISNLRCRYQILNGHHRAEVLRELGHTRARCDVWEVDDDEARVLLATLNRLEGRDDPSARGRLVAHLAEGRTAEELARLLPEPPDAVERLLHLAQPPPAPLAPEAVAPIARPMTFFLAEEQHALVAEALREAARDPGAPGHAGDAGGPESRRVGTPRPKRADALERLALWYLESRGLR